MIEEPKDILDISSGLLDGEEIITVHRSEENVMGMPLNGLWMRNREWFFNWNIDSDIKALYNILDDPRNDNNLADDYPELIRQFSKKTKNWKELHGK